MHGKLSFELAIKLQRLPVSVSLFSYDIYPGLFDPFYLHRDSRGNLYESLATTPRDADMEYCRSLNWPFISPGGRHADSRDSHEPRSHMRMHMRLSIYLWGLTGYPSLRFDGKYCAVLTGFPELSRVTKLVANRRECCRYTQRASEHPVLKITLTQTLQANRRQMNISNIMVKS